MAEALPPEEDPVIRLVDADGETVTNITWPGPHRAGELLTYKDVTYVYRDTIDDGSKDGLPVYAPKQPPEEED